MNGRQFHVCARCTGLLIGTVFSWALFPIHGTAFGLFVAVLVILLSDGITQLLRIRESNNALRLLSGLLFGATWAPSIYHVARM